MKALISPNEVYSDNYGNTFGMRVAAVADEAFDVAAPLFWVDCSDDTCLTKMYSGGVFLDIIKPPVDAPVPVVSAFQARAALLQAGLLDDVETYMAQPETDPFVRLAWDKAQEFRRDSPTVNSLAAPLGLTTFQLDDLFRFAKTITA